MLLQGDDVPDLAGSADAVQSTTVCAFPLSTLGQPGVTAAIMHSLTADGFSVCGFAFRRTTVSTFQVLPIFKRNKKEKKLKLENSRSIPSIWMPHRCLP
jgi:hypothetical protein